MNKNLKPVVKDEISNVATPFDLLKNPGDNLVARVTNSGKKVVKIETNNGNSKYSATKYPNGTIVETKTTK